MKRKLWLELEEKFAKKLEEERCGLELEERCGPTRANKIITLAHIDPALTAVTDDSSSSSSTSPAAQQSAKEPIELRSCVICGTYEQFSHLSDDSCIVDFGTQCELAKHIGDPSHVNFFHEIRGLSSRTNKMIRFIGVHQRRVHAKAKPY